MPAYTTVATATLGAATSIINSGTFSSTGSKYRVSFNFMNTLGATISLKVNGLSTNIYNSYWRRTGASSSVHDGLENQTEMDLVSLGSSNIPIHLVFDICHTNDIHYVTGRYVLNNATPTIGAVGGMAVTASLISSISLDVNTGNLASGSNLIVWKRT